MEQWRRTEGFNKVQDGHCQSGHSAVVIGGELKVFGLVFDIVFGGTNAPLDWLEDF